MQSKFATQAVETTRPHVQRAYEAAAPHVQNIYDTAAPHVHRTYQLGRHYGARTHSAALSTLLAMQDKTHKWWGRAKPHGDAALTAMQVLLGGMLCLTNDAIHLGMPHTQYPPCVCPYYIYQEAL